MLRKLLLSAYASWQRDSALPTAVRLEKATTYLRGVASAPLYLYACTSVGGGVRTYGRPRIVNHGKITIGAGTVLRSTVTAVELHAAPGACLTIGDGCAINFGCSFSADQEITLGNRVYVGPYVVIMDTQFHDIHERRARPRPKPVIIDDDVWIGVKASIMPGVRVGKGAVIAAHALVNKDVPPYTVVAGVPAKQIGEVDPERLIID